MNKQIRQFNKMWMQKYFATLAVVGAVACTTSGDLRAEKDGGSEVVGSGEVRTIPRGSAPVQQQQQQQQQPQARSGGVAQTGMNEEMAREIEILKGQLQEKEYLRQQEKAQLEARIQSQEQEKSRMMEEIQILKGSAPALAAQSGDLLWETIRKDLNKQNYGSAAGTLKEFLENFPNDPRSEEALILKGQCEYAAEQFKGALVTFGTYLDKYPKGPNRAMAWLGQGTSLIRLKQKKDGVLFLEQCVSLHPKSKEAKVARRLLKTPNNVPPTIFI